MRETAFAILLEIDSVEADLRRLESRLTALRVKIRRDVLQDRAADYVPEREQPVTR